MHKPLNKTTKKGPMQKDEGKKQYTRPELTKREKALTVIGGIPVITS